MYDVYFIFYFFNYISLIGNREGNGNPLQYSCLENTSRNLLTTSSMIRVACLRDSCCWGLLIVSTETSTVRVRPIRRFAVRFNSSRSPNHKKFEISINIRHTYIYVKNTKAFVCGYI